MVSDVETTGQDTKVAIDLPDGQTVHMVVSLAAVRAGIDRWISSAIASMADPVNATPKNQMMRLSLNSALIAAGPMIAKLFWRGEGEPPRPGRKDDLMVWYIRFAADQIFSAVENSNSMLHLEASDVSKTDDTATIRIHAISTRSASGR